MCQWSGTFDNSSFGSCSSYLAFDTDEAMSASSQMVKADEALSESSWTVLAKGRKEAGGALTWRVNWRSWKS